MFKEFLKPILIGSIVLILNNSAQGQHFLEQSTSIGIDHEFQDRALMGGGAVFFDYDNDGDDDLYLTSGLRRDDLYINNGDGTFTKDLSSNGLSITRRYNTIGAGAADIDNDGDKELLVTTWEWYDGSGAPIANNLLFDNNGDGTFTEISEDAGLVEAAFSIGVTFFDFNEDGFLDFYIINYVDVPGFIRDSTGFITGHDSDCYENFFYLNNGDKTFTEMSEELLINHEGCTLASIASDYDMDGDMDLYVTNDYGPDIIPNVFFESQFPVNEYIDKSDETELGIAIYSMGVTSADYDHDLDFDYYVTNLGKNALMRNDEGIFENVSDSAGVGNEWIDDYFYATGWGTVFADFNNDSWDELFVSNGRIASIPSLPSYMTDPNKLYKNNGDGTFTDISDAAGISNPNYGRGVAYSDYDMDGDLDMVVVFLSEQGGRTQFYVNQEEGQNHYVQFKLTGVKSNNDAIGAKVFVHAGGTTTVKEAFGGGSFCSQSSSVIHFGLGDVEGIDSVRIEWPNDHIDVIYNLSVDTVYAVEEFMDFNSPTVDPVHDDHFFSAHPNPAKDFIYITLNETNTGTTIWKIYDMQGRVIQSSPMVNGAERIELEGLMSGIYILSVENSTNKSTKRIVISD